MARGTRGGRKRPEQAAARREAEAERRSRRGDEPGARAAWRSAAESWRVADRPVAAARALARALAGGPPDALGSALLAGVLQDLGQLLPARAAAEDAVAAATGLGPRILALDVLTGAHLLLGELDAARAVLSRLSAIEAPAAQLAAIFRSARLDRLDGQLDRAVASLQAVRRQLPATDPRLSAPRAAAAQDIAELQLLAGHLQAARAAHAAAVVDWERSGRRPGRFAAEGLAVRLSLARGETVLPDVLALPVAFADERGLPLLGAELRIARGRARAAAGLPSAAEDFDHAVAAAGRAEAPLLEGRARLWRRVAGCPAAEGDLRRTRVLLGPDRVLSRHAVLARPAGRNSEQVPD